MMNAQAVPHPVRIIIADDVEQHSIPQTILLHLLPGAAIFLVFVGLLQLLGQYNLPSQLIFVLTLPLALAPTQLGLLFYLGWRRNGRLSLDGIVLYREPIEMKHYFWLVPLMFMLTVALFITISSFSEPIYQMFDWWPGAWRIALDLTAHSEALLLTTYVMILVCVGIIGPTVEELYFRGFLLPRLSRFGIWAALIETTLFGLYHLWSPWMLVERAIAFLPITIFTQIKRNIYVVIIVHCAINLLLSIPLLLEILAV